MKILCISATSQYRVLNAFFDAFVAAARSAGHDVTCVEVGSPAASDADSAVDLVFSLGGLAADVGWRVPYATWLVDHPVLSPRVFELRSGRDRAFVVAEEHASVINDFFGVDVPVGFVPHGFAGEGDTEAPDFTDRSRDIDVLFAGSYDEVAPPRWTTTDTRVDGALTSAVELVEERWNHAARDLNVSAIFREAAARHGLPEVAEGHRLVAPVLGVLDMRTRQLRRAACVRALDQRGVVVHLVGTGWERFAGLEHAVVIGPVDYSEVLALQRRAKVALNIGPAVFNRGWHERIPLAMGTGALCVSETNDFLEADAAIGGVIETFEMERHDELADVVRSALSRPDRHERTRAAFREMRERHTWRHRAEIILDQVT
jgi:hypothetical protein